MAHERIVIGTRGSDLALWQAQWVQHELERRIPGLGVELSIVKTTGDRILDSPLSKIGDKGLFTKEIEIALLDRRIDVAVHSLKDLPTLTPDGLAIGAITEREDVRDAFIPHPDKRHSSFAGLPRGAVVATGSLRRKSQLLNLRPDLSIADIRGNLRTRFSKLAASEWDGMLLASAGVRRLGMESHVGFFFEPDDLLPAVGQGTLGIEIRTGDERIASIVETLNHRPTASAALAERALLRRLEGGCQIPIGAYGKTDGRTLRLDGVVSSLDGRTLVRDSISGPESEPDTIGRALAERLLDKGAETILQSIRPDTAKV